MADYSEPGISTGSVPGSISKKICRTCRAVVLSDDSCDCTAPAGASPVAARPAEPDLSWMTAAGIDPGEYERIRQQILGSHSVPGPILPEPERGMRIESDGSPNGTKVFFNGERVTHVRSVTWTIYNDQMAQVNLELSGVPVTVNAVVPPEVLVRCQCCNELVGEHTCGEPTI